MNAQKFTDSGNKVMELDDKPGSVPEAVKTVQAAVIPLGQGFLPASSDLPEDASISYRPGQSWGAFLFGLAPDGVCLAYRVTAVTGGLLPHLFTLTEHLKVQGNICLRRVHTSMHF